MTTEMNDKQQAEREAFEKWARGRLGFGTAGNSPDYSLGATRDAWEVWKGALSHLSDAQKKEGEAVTAEEAHAIHSMPYVRSCLLEYANKSVDETASEVVKAIATQVQALRTTPQAAAEAPAYPLPDSLYPGSKDWAASNYAGRVEWLHVMYESAKRTVAMLERALATKASAEAPALPDVVRQLLNHIEDVIDDDNWGRIDVAKWNAVTALATPTDSAVNAGAVSSDALADFLSAQDALDNHELNGQNGTDYFTLVRRRNDARKDLDAALATKADSSEADPARLCPSYDDRREDVFADPYPGSPASAQVGEVDRINLLRLSLTNIAQCPDAGGAAATRRSMRQSAVDALAADDALSTAQPQADADPAGDNPWHDKPKADSTEAPEVSDDKTDHEWVEFCRPFVYMNGSHEMPNYPGICRAVLALRPKAQPLTDAVRDYKGVRCMCLQTGCKAGPGCPQYTAHCKAHIAHGIASSTKEGGNG